MDEGVYVGHGEGIGWAGMMNGENKIVRETADNRQQQPYH